jgi:son of sevenless-like protein
MINLFSNSIAAEEYIVFITENSHEKWQWMSMLCYTQYKIPIDRLLPIMTEEQNKNNPLPIPPENYIFDHPDSPETILFEQPLNSIVDKQQMHQKQPTAYVSTDGLTIKAATLIKLIEHLTHYLYLYPKFSHKFLMCFREFCTTHELIDLLIKRYDVPDLNINQTMLDNYTKYLKFVCFFLFLF